MIRTHTLRTDARIIHSDPRQVWRIADEEATARDCHYRTARYSGAVLRPARDDQAGTWIVLSLKGLAAGLVKHPLGEQPSGCATVTATRMWLLFVDSKRPAPTSAALTDAGAIAAMKKSVAWTGQYA